jgi:cell division protease FtsH
MGGRIAEKLIFGPEAVTTGAGSDLENVATLAKEMIVEEGMGSKLRNLVFPEGDVGYYTIQAGKPYSEKTAELIDEEIKHLSEEASARAEAVLKANKKVLDNLAKALLEQETLEVKELEPILKPATLPASAKLHD